MMRHLRVAWRHNSAAEPVELVSELDTVSGEIRKVERFRDGAWGWADSDATGGPTRLGIEPVPPLVQINDDPEFSGPHVDQSEFETMWQLARAACGANPAPSPLHRA